MVERDRTSMDAAGFARCLEDLGIDSSDGRFVYQPLPDEDERVLDMSQVIGLVARDADCELQEAVGGLVAYLDRRLGRLGVGGHEPAFAELVKGLIPRAKSIGHLYGPPGQHKTFLALGLCLSVANGLDQWVGFDVIRRDGDPLPDVALFEFEGDDAGLRQRIDAWLEGHPGTTDERLHAFMPDGDAFDLARPETLHTAVARLDLIGPRLIVIDPFRDAARSMTDETHATQVQAALRNAEDMFARYFDCPLMVVHHANKQGGLAGASSHQSKADFIVKVDKGQLLVTKTRNGALPELPVKFQMVEAPTVGSLYPVLAGPRPRVSNVDQLLGAAGRFSEPFTQQDLLPHVDFTESTLKREVRRAVDDGLLTVVKEAVIGGKDPRPARYQIEGGDPC